MERERKAIGQKFKMAMRAIPMELPLQCRKRILKALAKTYLQEVLAYHAE